MARRLRDPRGYEEEEGRSFARRRRSGGMEGTLIAIAIAGVIGIVAIIILAGGASGDEEIAEGRQFLRNLFETFVQDHPNAGSPMVDPRQILDHARNVMEKWDTLSPQEQADWRKKAWELTRQRFLSDLKIKDMAEAETTILAPATAEWRPSFQEVRFEWTHLGKAWWARLRKTDDGFVLLYFQERRGT